MLIEQIIEFQMREPKPQGRTYTPISGNFIAKQKSLRKIFE